MEHYREVGIDQAFSSGSDVSLFPTTQATRATFTDLYFGQTVLIFIRTGSKRVHCAVNGDLTGEAGDVMVFPPDSVVTMENRPVLNASYRADGVGFTDDLVEAVFSDQPRHKSAPGIQVLRAAPHRPLDILGLITETLSTEGLPPPIKRHRLLEPLIWLRHNGVRLPTRGEEQPWSKVRRFIETDLSRPWRITEVTGNFAMSEATFRRWLSKSGIGFAQILSNARLERGLFLLQTTDAPISQIALECGFKTPSHFSESFRKRFGIKPGLIRFAEI